VLTAGRTAVMILTLLFFSLSDYDLALGQGQSQHQPLLTYKNPNLGVSIQYPSDWRLEERSNDKLNFVKQEGFVSADLNVENLEQPNIPLSEYANTKVNELRSQRPNFQLIGFEPTTVSNDKTAQRVVYTFEREEDGKTNKVMRIWSINEGKLYTLAYIAESSQYDRYLPSFQRMVDSFNMVAEDSGTSRSTTQVQISDRGGENRTPTPVPTPISTPIPPPPPTPTPVLAAQGQFLTYENPDYNISIQYPNNWIPSEENLAPHQVVSISAPEAEEEESSVSTIIYIPAELFVAVQPLYSPGMTMNQFIDQFLNETYSSPNEYRIIESSNATFAGMPAQKIVLYEYVEGRTTKVERTIGIQNGTAYMTKYVAEPGQYSTYYPVAQRMIDSFQPSLRQQVAGVPQTQLDGVPSNLTQSQNGTEPLAQSTLSEQRNQTDQGGILLQPPSGDLNQPAQLPDELLVTDNVFGDSRLPLESYTTNGIVTDITSSRATKGELSEWYPIVIFNFNEPSQLGLVNVEHVLSGPIKSYDSPEDILEDANYWKDIPLNEQVVLEMNQPGLNYLVAAVQFANGTYGVYSGTMDVDAFGAKSDGEDYLDFQMDEGADFNILDKSDIEDIQSDPGFQQAASDSICSELNENGFQVCQQ
jgi:PsbP-like protein